MNSIKLMKHSALVALILSFAVGCAGTPEEGGSSATSGEAGMEQMDATQADAEQAIRDAKAMLAEAEAAGAAWRDTGKMIKQAEELMAEGKYAEAVAMANEARQQSENALVQKMEEEERLGIESSGVMGSSNADSYTVEKGDSLWAIAGKSSIYNNPYQWPMIYKANRDQIKDADLIYPGQMFTITRGASQVDIDAAVHHAKTRGAWSLGTVEESDMQYLAR